MDQLLIFLIGGIAETNQVETKQVDWRILERRPLMMTFHLGAAEMKLHLFQQEQTKYIRDEATFVSAGTNKVYLFPQKLFCNISEKLHKK